VNSFLTFLLNRRIIWLAAGIFTGLYWISQSNYLLFHTLAEMFSILMAGSIFVLAWNTRNFLKNGYLEVLGIGMLFVAILDLLHTLSFKGMGVFVGNSANLSTQFWLAARYLHSGSMLFAVMFIHKSQTPRGWVLLAYSAATALLLALIYTQVFPVSLVESGDAVSLTPFKIASEYAVALVFLVGMALLWRARQAFDSQVLLLLLFSAGFSALAELLFTGYIQVTDMWNLVGHFAKLISFYLIYKAIVETGFVRPYRLLFRELNQSETNLRASELRERQRAAQLEAVMDAVPAVVWIASDPECKVVTGNRASYEFLRMPQNTNQSKTAPPQEVPTHFRVLQNGRELAPHELPLQRSAASGLPVRDFEETVLFDNGEARQLYGNVTPLLDSAGRPAGAVSVFIDITERVRAEQALQESERRYRRLFETITEGFAILEILYDEQGQAVDYRFLEVNPLSSK
jgi:PAS domain-containing protein